MTDSEQRRIQELQRAILAAKTEEEKRALEQRLRNLKNAHTPRSKEGDGRGLFGWLFGRN